MPAPTQSMEGIVLNRVEAGESYLRVYIFSSKMGLKAVLFRLSKKHQSIPPPDLFDELEIILSLPKDGQGLPFVKDWKVFKKRTKLAICHKRFHVASTLSRFFLENGSHLQDVLPFYKLLCLSLDSLVNGYDPNYILYKTLFRFGQLEGLPVKEDWLANLAEKKRVFGKYILKTKLEDLETGNEMVADLIESLKDWLNRETELRS